jgi:hypothetical protein
MSILVAIEQKLGRPMKDMAVFPVPESVEKWRLSNDPEDLDLVSLDITSATSICVTTFILSMERIGVPWSRHGSTVGVTCATVDEALRVMEATKVALSVAHMPDGSTVIYVPEVA